MKRFALLAIMAAFVLGTVATASAVEIKASGDWRVHANWVDNMQNFDAPFDNGKNNTRRTPEDDFNVYQRARIWFNFIANENLKAVLGLEIGDITWGNTGGGQIGADGVNIETKHAYLDFNIPGAPINVKAGIQPIALPSNLGSAILDDDMAALVLTGKINENFSAVVGYSRLYNKDGARRTVRADGFGGNSGSEDEVDAMFAILPIKYSSFSIDPFFMAAFIGRDSVIGQAIGQSDPIVPAYWFGFRGDVSAFDPFTIMFDFNYGTYDDYGKARDMSGYYFDLVVDYKMSMMTPELFFFYASGFDKTSKVNNKTIMPTVSGAFGATTTVFDGSALDAGTGLDATIPQGLWGIGLKLKDITFVEKLTHTLTIAYLQGTNHKSNSALVSSLGVNGLTTKDSAWEVDFDTEYKIYENLTGILELGYVNLKLDKNIRNITSDDYKSDAWKVRTGFRYKF